ncbi:MAG: O-antigen ligase family protein [Bacteroidetes bacterium]|nr:O-antigen ligase family protein [Bacteroidota bacterium]MCW5897357.1 O-antigen ligase family protein [Bacteroidota bacterium]
MAELLREAWPARAGNKAIAYWVASALVTLLFAKLAADSGHQSVALLLRIVSFSTVGWIAFQRPQWGIVILAGTLPVEMLLPPVKFATSMYPVMGGATLAGYVVHHLLIRKEHPAFTWPHLFAVLFLLWISVSNPAAAFTRGGYLWFMTFLQLTIFLWLTTQLIRTERERLLILSAFTGSAVLSALWALPQVQFGIDSATSLRAGGLTGGPNITGAVYGIGVVFLFHLATISDKLIVRLGAIVFSVVLFAGLASTVSRTALIALILGLLFLFFTDFQRMKKQKLQFVILFVLVSLICIPSGFWQIASGILTSILTGTDSIGFRYMQWEAALSMWKDNPWAGVGIGQFRYAVVFYGEQFVPFYGLGYGAHNIVLALMTETGLVGTMLFMMMITASFASLFRFFREESPTRRHFAAMWLTVSLMALFRGVTADTHFEKMLWLFVGFHGNPVKLGLLASFATKVRKLVSPARRSLLSPVHTEIP